MKKLTANQFAGAVTLLSLIVAVAFLATFTGSGKSLPVDSETDKDMARYIHYLESQCRETPERPVCRNLPE